MSIIKRTAIGFGALIGLLIATTAAVAIIKPTGDGLFATSLTHETVIDAPPEVVWAILSDFKTFPKWNPFVVKIEGDMIVGRNINVAVAAPPGAKPMQFNPEVLVVEQAREFKWRGKLLVPGLFDGEHSFKMEALPEGRTKFIHGEGFSGVLVPYYRMAMAEDTSTSFKAMDTALAARAKTMAAANEIIGNTNRRGAGDGKAQTDPR